MATQLDATGHFRHDDVYFRQNKLENKHSTYRRTWLSSAYAYGEKSSKLGASHPGALAKIDQAHQFHDVTDAKGT